MWSEALVQARLFDCLKSARSNLLGCILPTKGDTMAGEVTARIPRADVGGPIGRSMADMVLEFLSLRL